MAASQRALDLGPRTHFDLLHGGHRSRVAVATRAGGLRENWQERTYAHDDAAAMVAGLVDDFCADLYLSQAGFSGNRATRNVAALTSCYVDLDTYNVPELAGLAPEAVLDLAIAAHPWMPPPTLLASSGRGVYFVWVLTRHLGPNMLPRWQAVEAGLVDALTDLGADAAVKDAARVLRVAGSSHVNAGARVEYRQVADPVAFSDLEARVLEHCAPAPRSANPRPSTGNNVARIWNGRTLAWSRMQDLADLARARGPLTDYRARFLYAYAVAAAWYCHTPRALVIELDAFAGEFFVDAHRYRGATQCKTILDRVAKSRRGLKVPWRGREVDPRYRMHNRTLIALLDITPEEQRGLRAIMHKSVSRARENQKRSRQRRDEYLAERSQARRKKHEEAVKLLEQGHTVSSAARALGVSRQTFHKRLSNDA